MADLWQLRCGTASSWDVLINAGLDPTTQEPIPLAPGVFVPADVPAATVWAGRGRPALFAPAATWIDGTCTSIRVAFAAAQTAGVLPAYYPVDVQVLPVGADPIDVGAATLVLVAAPGTQPAGQSHITIQDVQDWAPWVLQAEDLGVDLAGFARQLERATSWLNDVIVALWKAGNAQPSMGQPGYAAWMLNGWTADAPESVYLRGLLAANALIVRDKTREIVACKAAELIAAGQVADKYRKLGREYERRARRLLSTYRAEIDPDGSGYATIVVHCGATNLR